MTARVRIIAALAIVLWGSTDAGAQPKGIQWTPDALRILVNKDVGNERWAITWNLIDVSTTGNVFFSDVDRSPAFIACEKIDHDFAADSGELNLQFRCFGADTSVGGFHLDDWTLISNDVVLPASFFIPPAETCDLTGALNGPNAGSASSLWHCDGNAGHIDFQFFSNGRAFSSATGAFDYDVVAEACRIAQLDDRSFIDVEYSPSRDKVTVYEFPPAVDHVIVSECERRVF